MVILTCTVFLCFNLGIGNPVPFTLLFDEFCKKSWRMPQNRLAETLLLFVFVYKTDSSVLSDGR